MSRLKSHRSISDRINEELNPFARPATAGDHDDDAQAQVTSLSREDAEGAMSNRRGTAARRLQRRGPLDDSLTTGRYSVAPTWAAEDTSGIRENDRSRASKRKSADDHFTAADAEAAMDDLFGLLDDRHDSGAKAAGVKSAEDYEAWWDREHGKGDAGKSEKAVTTTIGKKRSRRQRDDDDDAMNETTALVDIDDDGAQEVQAVETAAEKISQQLLDADVKHTTSKDDRDVLSQIKSLRERHLSVVSGATLADESPGHDAASGGTSNDVARSRALVRAIGQILSLRVKMQAGVARAVGMPQYYSLPHFVGSAAARDAGTHTPVPAEARVIRDSLSTARRDLRAVLATLVADESSTTASPDHILTMPSAALWNEVVSPRHDAWMAYVDAYLQTVGAAGGASGLSGGGALKALNQPILSQIKAVISGKIRLLARAQRNRVHCCVFGHPTHSGDNAASRKQRALQVAEGDMDDEVFDDVDFVRDLAQKFGRQQLAVAQNQTAGGNVALSASAKDLDALKQMKDSFSSRQGLHKKTKGRAVNMQEPRPKLVGFALPRAFEFLPAQHDALYRSVFQ